MPPPGAWRLTPSAPARARVRRAANRPTMPEAARPARRADAEPQGADERRERKPREEAEFGMDTFRIDVGHAHGVKPANIVGAIANEAGLEARYIGRIDIHDDYSTVDLPEGMPKELQTHLKKVWVSGQQLNLRRLGEAGGGPVAAVQAARCARSAADGRRTGPARLAGARRGRE
jgi:ATP-dependent RNA helicase DeaD